MNNIDLTKIMDLLEIKRKVMDERKWLRFESKCQTWIIWCKYKIGLYGVITVNEF